MQIEAERPNTIEEAKSIADRKAEESAALIRRFLLPIQAMMMPTPYRFYRRMAGFAGRDAKERG